MLVTESQDQRGGEYYLDYRDKKVRSARTALKTLHRAGLVRLPRFLESRSKFENLQLLDEEGLSQEAVDPIEYHVPSSTDVVFEVPSDLVRKGWVHVLEDSEIAVLLMLYCGFGRISGEPTIAIPSATRIGNYGISQNAYSSYAMLQAFGLLEYQGMSRHSDGTVEDFDSEDATLTRFTLVPEGLRKSPVPLVEKALSNSIAGFGD